MDYSASNMQLWNFVLQIGIIAVTIIVANVIRRKVPFIKSSLVPTAVLGGFLLLAAKLTGLVRLDAVILECITYHCIAIGFIAMSLRVPEKNTTEKGDLTGLKSGAVIVGSYMIQGIAGLLITLMLSYTVMPDLFKASGILLPMGYGQGPGQANNIGLTYESLGFKGGRSFGLAIAAMGYVCACVVGVVYINYLVKSGKFKRSNLDEFSGSVTVDEFQSNNEIPISESVDRFSIQAALVIAVYLVTFLVTKALTGILTRFAPGAAATVNTLLWGFNFMIGSALAIATRAVMKKLQKARLMTRRYQNNYLLSRISGFAFDLMIVTGIASINIEDLSGLWLPFVLLSIAGAVVTFFHLRFVCRKVYPEYFYEAFISMYGMMTGTISSGVLLLRELDPVLETPAANNLIIGSSFAILLAAPLLILVGIAPNSPLMTIITLVLLVIYYFVLLWIVNLKKKKTGQK